MKKWLVIALALLFLSGCSLHKAWKWFDEMEWEKEDETCRVVDFFFR